MHLVLSQISVPKHTSHTSLALSFYTAVKLHLKFNNHVKQIILIVCVLEKYHNQLKFILFKSDDLLLRLHIVKAFFVSHSDLLVRAVGAQESWGRTQAEYVVASAQREIPYQMTFCSATKAEIKKEAVMLQRCLLELTYNKCLWSVWKHEKAYQAVVLNSS